MDYTVHGILQVETLEEVAIPFSRGSSNPGTEPRSPTLLVDSLPAEPDPWPHTSQCAQEAIPRKDTEPADRGGGCRSAQDSAPCWDRGSLGSERPVSKEGGVLGRPRQGGWEVTSPWGGGGGAKPEGGVFAD